MESTFYHASQLRAIYISRDTVASGIARYQCVRITTEWVLKNPWLPHRSDVSSDAVRCLWPCCCCCCCLLPSAHPTSSRLPSCFPEWRMCTAAALPTDGRKAMAIVRRFARRRSLRTKTIVVI